jgi:hypothetical protein
MMEPEPDLESPLLAPGDKHDAKSGPESSGNKQTVAAVKKTTDRRYMDILQIQLYALMITLLKIASANAEGFANIITTKCGDPTWDQLNENGTEIECVAAAMRLREIPVGNAIFFSMLFLFQQHRVARVVAILAILEFAVMSHVTGFTSKPVLYADWLVFISTISTGHIAGAFVMTCMHIVRTTIICSKTRLSALAERKNVKTMQAFILAALSAAYLSMYIAAVANYSGLPFFHNISLNPWIQGAMLAVTCVRSNFKMRCAFMAYMSWSFVFTLFFLNPCDGALFCNWHLASALDNLVAVCFLNVSCSYILNSDSDDTMLDLNNKWHVFKSAD